MKKLTQAAVLILALILPLAAEPGGISHAGWSQNGQYLVTTGPSLRVRVHDGATGLVIKAVTAPGEPTAYRSFSPDSGEEIDNSIEALGVSGERALTGSTDGILHWWSVPELSNLASTEISYSLVGLNLGGDGNIAAYTDSSTRYLDSSVMLLRLQGSDIQSSSFSIASAPYSNSSFGVPQLSPDGEWAIGSINGVTQLWNTQTLDMPATEIGDITLAALGSKHFTCITTNGISLRTYDRPLEEVRLIACSDVQSAYVDPAETRLVARHSDAITTWNLKEPTAAPRIWPKKVEGMTPSPDGHRAIFWIGLKALEVWDLDSQTKLYRLERKGDLAEAAAR